MARSAPVLIALLLFGAAGCGDRGLPTSPFSHEDAPVLMSASEYVLEAGSRGWRGELEFTYQNVTNRTISLLNCRGGFAYRLEKWTEEGWITAWAPVLLMCLSPPIRIAPGGEHEHVAGIFGGYPGGNTYPRFSVDEVDGIYRVVIDGAYWNYDHDGPSWGNLPPEPYRVSAPFRIRTN